MPWAPRVRQWHIRRLYHWAKSGIYDDELLLEVGWGLYARCADVLTVTRAMGGAVPCPACGQAVQRARYHPDHRPRAGAGPTARFACPACKAVLTWQECREALRNHPQCFACRRRLQWEYRANQLACGGCGGIWSWQQYRRSVRGRRCLPCPRCGSTVRRPERTGRGAQSPDAGGAVSAPPVALTCPRCRGAALHSEGKIRCLQCGYEQKWGIYRKRLKRRAEHLQCGACGYAFTWAAWHRSAKGGPLLTGNPAPAAAFLARWPHCQTPQAQLIEIDALLHALHGRGALGPLFVEGDAASVLDLLNELARRS